MTITNCSFYLTVAETMSSKRMYILYLKLLNSKEARDDSEKRLNVLNSLCNSSELSGHKAEQPKWLQQQLDLAKETGNSYYHAKALVSMGQNIFFEGDRAKGIQYVNETIRPPASAMLLCEAEGWGCQSLCATADWTMPAA
jgi:hypothetical protein